MTGAIHPADGLAAALVAIASNPEIATAAVDTPEPAPTSEGAAALEIVPEPAPADEPRGLLSVYDAQRLRFGRELRTFTKYTRINPAANTLTQLVGRDPRRIRIELSISSSNGADQQGLIGPLAAMQANQGFAVELSITLLYAFILREYSTDGDSVSEDLYVQSNNAAMVFCARETLLTPLPVDKSCD